MRLHIVFELAVGPEVDRGEVDVMAGVAAASFNEAMRPLGACKLARIQAPLESAVAQGRNDGARRSGAMSEALDQLAVRIGQRAIQVHANLEHLRNVARDQARDFYTLAVADALEIDYYAVMPLERHAAKMALFAFTYDLTRV
jgi:hypothetical protein